MGKIITPKYVWFYRHLQPSMVSDMNIHKTIYRINELIDIQLESMTKITFDCGCRKYNIYVDDECVLMTKDDCVLFEIQNSLTNIKIPDRMELGDYILYLSEDRQVSNFINQIKEKYHDR